MLVFDVETTGLPRKLGFRKYASPDKLQYYNTSRVVEIGWILCNSEGKVLSSESHYIKPERGVHISQGAFKVHGISLDHLNRHGEDAKSVLRKFSEAFARVDCIVAHNLDFDRHIVASELARHGMAFEAFMQCDSFCTMRRGTSACKMLGKYGNYKVPKLTELYRHLTGNTVKQTHRALEDAEIVHTCAVLLGLCEKED